VGKKSAQARTSRGGFPASFDRLCAKSGKASSPSFSLISKLLSGKNF
jgi:hypothetical protein